MMKRIREENVGKNRSQFQAVREIRRTFRSCNREIFREYKVEERDGSSDGENGANSRNIANDVWDLAKKIAAHDGVDACITKAGMVVVQVESMRHSQYKGGNDTNANSQKILPNAKRESQRNPYRGFASLLPGRERNYSTIVLQVHSFYQRRNGERAA